MVYTPTGKAFSVETKSPQGCNFKGSWYDPITGSYAPFDYSQCSSGSVRKFSPPSGSGHNDWLLVLETGPA